MHVTSSIPSFRYYFLSVMPSELRARQLFGPDVTPVDYLAYNISLIFVNTHFSIDYPRPLVPNIIEIGGVHIGTPKPLPTVSERDRR